MPDPSKQGVKKLHPTDATQNLGLFVTNQEEHNLSIVDYSEVKGYEGEPLGFGVRTDVARKKGELMGLIVFGELTTEEKFVKEAQAKGEPPEFPRNPGAFALQTPYEEGVCLVADNCPARFVNDAKGVPGAKPNIRFVQHPDPRQLFFDPLRGLHLLLQAEALCDIAPGDQLFSAYGDNFWQNGAPINRGDIDETKLEDLGEPPLAIRSAPQSILLSDSDDEAVFARTPQSQKPKNALTLTQVTPVTPLGTFDDTTKELEKWDLKSPKPSSSKKPKPKEKTPKSGGAKDMNLDELPQTNSKPKGRGQSKRGPSPPTGYEDEETSDVEWTPSGRSSNKHKKSKTAETSKMSPKTSTKKDGKQKWEESKTTPKSKSDEKARLKAAEAQSATKAAKTPTPKKVAGYDFLLYICNVVFSA
jgi:hypothetical protein